MLLGLGDAGWPLYLRYSVFLAESGAAPGPRWPMLARFGRPAVLGHPRAPAPTPSLR